MQFYFVMNSILFKLTEMKYERQLRTFQQVSQTWVLQLVVVVANNNERSLKLHCDNNNNYIITRGGVERSKEMYNNNSRGIQINFRFLSLLDQYNNNNVINQRARRRRRRIRYANYCLLFAIFSFFLICCSI